MPFLRAYAGLSLVALCAACSTEEVTPSTDVPDAPTEISVSVAVDPSVVRSTVPPLGFGMHSSVYDNSLHDGSVPGLLNAAGITLLRYPGGGYSDNYHWSTHSLVPSYGGTQVGYLADRSDFGSYVSLLEAYGGTAMITVNYGSNLTATGPGEPKQAAAWVAYANGALGDATLIGVDSTGMDWHTVDYWASLRAAAPLAGDDELNFLRIAHPAPLDIRYWEIGNEIFGNGYYTDDTGYEEDLHAPYTGSSRRGDARLSPTAYGNGVKTYISVMKAVDPSIQIGAVLNTPPLDYSWGPDWDASVLAACGQDIDFAMVHWYSSNSLASLLLAPTREVPAIFSELGSLFAAVGPRSAPIQVAVTEMGPGSGLRISNQQGQVEGLFASDGYLALLEQGVFNIDWLELHNETFLASPSERKGPAYKGIQMAHELASPGDALLATTTDSAALAVHTSARADGRMGVMLVNRSSTAKATVTVDFGAGMSFASAQRYDYAPTSGAVDGSVVGPSPVADLTLPLTVVVPAYGEAVLLLSR